MRIFTFLVVWREKSFSSISKTVAKHHGGIFHPSPRLLTSQTPRGKAVETSEKTAGEKFGSEPPDSSEIGYCSGASPAEARGERLGFLASAGIYLFLSYHAPGSRQVTTVKDSEVASCCSLRKWQEKSLCACDSGCLRLGTGEEPSSGRSSRAQGQLQRVFISLCSGVNREHAASVRCAKTPRQKGGLGSGVVVP